MKDYSRFNKGIKEKMNNNDVIIFEKMLKYEKGFDVYVNNSDKPIKAIINLKKTFTSSSEMEEIIQTLPHNIKRGDYLRFRKRDNSEYHDYIITSEIKEKESFDEAVFVKCNQILKFKIDGVEYQYPCRIDNESYGVKLSTATDYYNEIDQKLKIVIKQDEHTSKIPLDYRIIFSNSETDIYKISNRDMSIKSRGQNDGTITFTCKKVVLVDEDDINDNDAFNKIEVINPSVNIEILGDYEIEFGQTKEYKLSDHVDGTWELNDITLECGLAEIVDVKDDSCFVKSLCSNSEFIALYYKDSDGKILATKDIMCV